MLCIAQAVWANRSYTCAFSSNLYLLTVIVVSVVTSSIVWYWPKVCSAVKFWHCTVHGGASQT